MTMLFEGQKDHLVPCASQPLLDSDLFMMAGRLVGHSFIHSGPGLAGISPAVVHVLLGGQLETATLVLEDCPDRTGWEVLSWMLKVEVVHGQFLNPPPVTCASASLATSQLIMILNKLLRHPSGHGIQDLDSSNAAECSRLMLINLSIFTLLILD